MWVVAPHPDDEVLMAGETLAAALREGREVDVYVLTNGDLGCGRDGHRRQGETVQALAALGLGESRVHFLGYPDGHLSRLSDAELPPLERRAVDGTCALATGTYASRGSGGVELHRARTGEPAPYTRGALVEDLATALAAERPADLYVAHPFDAHPDHASTYLLVREALERAEIAPPRLHRAMVHAGPCWPNGAGTAGPCPPVRESLGTPFPPLPGPLSTWSLDERVPVADGGRRKRAAIALYTSQLETPDAADDWLSAFGRADEPFEAERLAPGADGQLVRAGSRVEAQRSLARGASADLAPALEGSASDPALPGGLRVTCGPEALTLSAPGLERSTPLPDEGPCELTLHRLGPERGGQAELEVRVGGRRRAVWPWPTRRSWALRE